MKEFLIQTLESVDFHNLVFLQGSLPADAAYPERFVTFLTIGTDDAEHFDNEIAGTTWRFQVANYATDPLTVARDADALRVALKAAGFIPQGKGFDLMSDEPTHTGWVNEYLFLEMEA